MKPSLIFIDVVNNHFASFDYMVLILAIVNLRNIFILAIKNNTLMFDTFSLISRSLPCVVLSPFKVGYGFKLSARLSCLVVIFL